MSEMLKNFIVIIVGLISGVAFGYFIITYLPHVMLERSDKRSLSLSDSISVISSPAPKANKEVLGFLPFWLLSNAKPDYAGFITNLDYFSITPDTDGTILKYTAPGESEPGYYALVGGRLDTYFQAAKAKNIKLSLTVFDGNQDAINELISDPVPHADNLVNDVAPLISQYGFSDLNLDIESIGIASPSAQLNYESFVSEVHRKILSKNLGITLSDDIIPVDFIRNDHLSVPANLAKDLDKIIVMAYDFHSPSSFVTGPVAPLYGAGSIAEFDTEVAVNAALKNFDSSKILLGVPFYGYSWETIDNFERASIVPATAIIQSSKDVEDTLNSCNDCKVQYDDIAKESYFVKKTDSGTNLQFFYPDSVSVQSKIDFINGNNLGGVAIWALGYEGNSILNPIKNYLSH